MKTIAALLCASVFLLLIDAPVGAKVMVVGFLIVVAAVCFAATVSDARSRVAAARFAAAEDTDDMVRMLRQLGEDLRAEEDDWAEWLGRAPGFDSPPLGSVTPLPSRARVIRFPQQRDGGA